MHMKLVSIILIFSIVKFLNGEEDDVAKRQVSGCAPSNPCATTTLCPPGGNSISACPAGTTGSRCETVYFKCNRNGRFKDPYLCSSGKYLECAYFGQAGYPNGVLFIRDCPPGLIYDQAGDHCGYAANVKC